MEINFGLGYGLQRTFNILNEGNGKLYGIESAGYLVDNAYKQLPRDGHQRNVLFYNTSVSFLPFNSNLMSVIYHVNCFFYWNNPSLSSRGCSEMFRVLKPGGKLVCTFDNRKIKRMVAHRFPVLSPLNYMFLLEKFGFENVKVHYHEFEGKKRNFQSIEANKPELILLE